MAEEYDYTYYIDNGIFDIQNGKYESAIENINKSIELKKDWEISYFYRGVANQALERFDIFLILISEKLFQI